MRQNLAVSTDAWVVCEQGRGGGGVAAESGAVVGNHNPEADAEAAHGPNPSVQREPSRATGSGVANGVANGSANGVASQAPANGNAASSSSSSDEDMENGQAGPTGRSSKAAKS